MSITAHCSGFSLDFFHLFECNPRIHSIYLIQPDILSLISNVASLDDRFFSRLVRIVQLSTIQPTGYMLEARKIHTYQLHRYIAASDKQSCKQMHALQTPNLSIMNQTVPVKLNFCLQLIPPWANFWVHRTVVAYQKFQLIEKRKRNKSRNRKINAY